MNISKDFYPQILLILKGSPLALLYAIFPDERILKIKSPDENTQQIPCINEIYNNIFIEGIVRRFMTDYEENTDKLWDLHTKVQGIVEVGFSSVLTINTSEEKHFKYPTFRQFTVF